MNFRVNEVPYKMARRALRKLRQKHSQDFIEWSLFCAADESICPDLYREPETEFGSTCNELDDRLLIEVAGNFGVDPVLLDDMLIAADYNEQDQLVGAALGVRRRRSAHPVF